MSDLVDALKAWAPLIASGYEVPAASTVMEQAAAEILRLRAELGEIKVDKDNAYEERNKVVALLARLFPSGLKKTDIPGWNPAWHGCVYIDLPTGQVSWHYHERQAHLFSDIQPYVGEWDGHDTPEKYRRVAALTDCSSIFRAGWIAGRDAAADRFWAALGSRSDQKFIRDGIRNMEPPA